MSVKRTLPAVVALLLLDVWLIFCCMNAEMLSMVNRAARSAGTVCPFEKITFT